MQHQCHTEPEPPERRFKVELSLELIKKCNHSKRSKRIK